MTEPELLHKPKIKKPRYESSSWTNRKKKGSGHWHHWFLLGMLITLLVWCYLLPVWQKECQLPVDDNSASVSNQINQPILKKKCQIQVSICKCWTLKPKLKKPQLWKLKLNDQAKPNLMPKIKKANLWKKAKLWKLRSNKQGKCRGAVVTCWSHMDFLGMLMTLQVSWAAEPAEEQVYIAVVAILPNLQQYSCQNCVCVYIYIMCKMMVLIHHRLLWWQ